MQFNGISYTSRPALGFDVVAAEPGDSNQRKFYVIKPVNFSYANAIPIKEFGEGSNTRRKLDVFSSGIFGCHTILVASSYH